MCPRYWRPSPSGDIVAVHEDAWLSAQWACAPLLKDAVELMPIENEEVRSADDGLIWVYAPGICDLFHIGHVEFPSETASSPALRVMRTPPLTSRDRL